MSATSRDCEALRARIVDICARLDITTKQFAHMSGFAYKTILEVLREQQGRKSSSPWMHRVLDLIEIIEAHAPEQIAVMVAAARVAFPGPVRSFPAKKETKPPRKPGPVSKHEGKATAIPASVQSFPAWLLGRGRPHGS